MISKAQKICKTNKKQLQYLFSISTLKKEKSHLKKIKLTKTHENNKSTDLYSFLNSKTVRIEVTSSQITLASLVAEKQNKTIEFLQTSADSVTRSGNIAAIESG
jgi:hypothetical protein